MASIYPRPITTNKNELRTRLKKGAWWISYYNNNKLIQHSLRTKEHKTAEHLKREKEIELERGQAKLPISKIIPDVFREYKEYARLKKTPETFKTDNQQLQKFFDFTKAHYLRDIKTKTIQLYLQDLAGKKKKPKTINNYLIIIKAFLNYCKHQGYIYDNPADSIKKLKVPKDPPRYFSRDEIKRLLEASGKSHLYPLIQTALYTGMRIGEIIKLEWPQVDFQNKSIIIKGTTAKSKKFRLIPIHDKLYSVLHPLKQNTGYVFTYKGKKYSKEPSQAFSTILDKAEIEDAGFHTLRHTFASWFLMSGGSIYELSKILGHASVETTQIYGHLAPDHIRKAINSLTF